MTRTHKVHWTTTDTYSQSPLVLDEATGLAWLHDRDGQIITPSPDLTIQTGPVAIHKPIYKGAIKAGYSVKAY
jgi:hypothetical protein